MGLDLQFTQGQTIAIVAGIVLATILALVGLRGWVSDRIRVLLTVLKVLGAVGLLILFIKPFWISRKPDPSAFRVVVLADLSASMLTEDRKGQPSRIAITQKALDSTEKGSWLSRLRRDWRVETMAFAGNVFPLAPGTWDTVAEQGQTALGDSLVQVLENGGDRIGSVVLLSDGHDNTGLNMAAVAEGYRAADVPVNVIGIGDHRPKGDLQVSFIQDELKGVAREPSTIEVVLRNGFSTPVQTVAVLRDGGEVLGTKPVNLPAKGEQTVQFDIEPQKAGARNLKVTVESPLQDTNASTDTDHAVMLVEAPELFRVLFLSNRMNQNYRFIKRILAAEERFEFNAILRVGEDKFLPFGKDIPDKWPEKPEAFNDFDVIFLDTHTLAEWDEERVKGIRDFVSKRGGGLLVFGPPEPGREKLGGIFPVVEAKETIVKDNRLISIETDPVFTPADEIGKLKLFLPGNLPGRIAEKLNRAAREVARIRSGGGSALVLQAYGAGKCAYLGTEHDWRWAMADDDGLDAHRKFWLGLSSWLGTGGEERILVESANQVHPGTKPVDLGIDLLGADFEPSDDALVEATVVNPSGEEQRVQLFPSSSRPGRYQADLPVRDSGDYEVSYRVVFGNGDSLEKEIFFGVESTGGEVADVEFREGTLQDLARLTGGRYYHYTQLSTANDLALARKLPNTERRVSLTDNLLFMALLVGLIGAEWILRRQSGLR
ncbi:MAG: hypothetical protein HN675_15490 [Opitutae bacterium]|nr:hypothetical protein [Opitutae bacterium]